MTRISRLLTVDDFEARARRLPRPVFDLIASGAGDELTLRANRAAFDRVVLRPRALRDVAQRNLETTVVHQPVALPLLLGPCGFARMIDPAGELAVARAAAAAGTVYVLSSGASVGVEAVAAAVGGRHLWLGLYLQPDRAQTERLVAGAERAGCTGLCLTIDGAVQVARPRDYRNRVTVPLRPTARLLVDGLRNPRWLWHFLRGRVARRPAVAATATDYWHLATRVVHSKSVTVRDLHWLRERWHGPLIVKGVMRAEECEALTACGVDAVVVSNHGGRLLDGTGATLDALAEIVEALDGRAEVLLDGGVRRGGDIVRAVALGARACMIGRPYLWGLAAGGEGGVARVLEIYRRELDQVMALTGCASIAEIDAGIAGRP